MKKLKLILGTGFGVGFSPIAPGTAGSLVILVPLYMLMQTEPFVLVTLFALLFSLITLWVTPACEEKWSKDPPVVVMDEWAGQCVALIGTSLPGVLSQDLVILITAFILFRIFDILKPMGINKLQNLPGRWGILADDLLAGLYTLICLKTLIFVWPDYIEMF
ncbi:MAG: phosphatidylglycerophosphatase A [Balneolaceae bacterium]|nr:phosphatidylglycerophosphatase A [Balneolaceae bacterium]